LNIYIDSLSIVRGLQFFLVLIKALMMQLREMDDTDSKKAIYGALDAWVAWEQNFPIGSLRNILLCLEKEQQWHRIVQVCIICVCASFLFSSHALFLLK